MKAIILLMTIFTISCASMHELTAYQKRPFGRDGGYTDWDLTKGSAWNGSDALKKYHPEFDFMIQVTLNGANDLKRASDFAHRRAAELSKEKGYSYYSYRILTSEYEKRITKLDGTTVSESSWPTFELLIKFEKQIDIRSKNIKVANDVLEETGKSLSIQKK